MCSRLKCSRLMWSRLICSRLLAFVLFLLPAQVLAGVKEDVAALAQQGLVLVMDADGNELVAQNVEEPFVPASVTKIVTAWLAMEVLGGDYRFETRFYLDAKRVLYVRGSGDPFLISEELAPLAAELVAAVGKEPITGIVIDASYYPSNLRIPGIERTGAAYNALNSALAVNFNTIYAVRDGKKVRSAEKQTPITPLAIAQFVQRAPNGTSRISLSQDLTVSLRYAGELIAAFVKQAGGSVKGKIAIGTVPKKLEPVYVHRQSRTLSDILDRAAPRFEQLRRQPGLPGDWRTSPRRAGQSQKITRGRKRDHSPRTASPRPSISRRARASAATTILPLAASPKCLNCLRPTPICSAAMMAA